MPKIAPLPDEGARTAVGDVVEGVEGVGEFVRNWWPEGGLGASDGEQG